VLRLESSSLRPCHRSLIAKPRSLSASLLDFGASLATAHAAGIIP
jgi:hypothetical protein